MIWNEYGEIKYLKAFIKNYNCCFQVLYKISLFRRFFTKDIFKEGS